MDGVRDVRERILTVAHDLVLERGFTGTTVDAVLEAAGASKGAFFHHFPSKAALAKAVIERYAATDADLLQTYMSRAEASTSDPGEQLIEFVRGFEDDIESGVVDQPGCMFASYVYEQIPEESGSQEVILGAIELWRARIAEKLRQAAAARPMGLPVDLDSLADHVFTVFEGGFVLARATKDPLKLRDQLAHLRAYLTLLLEKPADAARPSKGVSGGARRKPATGSVRGLRAGAGNRAKRRA